MEDYKEPEFIAYKFRDWDDANHRDLLVKNQVYLSSSKDLNDPSDCNIPICFDLLNTDEKKLEYAKMKVEHLKHHLKSRGLDLNNEVSRLYTKLRHSLAEIQIQHSEMMYESQANHHGILSLSLDWKNVLLWSHYSSKHTGFCVGFYGHKLRRKIGGGGPITYFQKEKFPRISPLEESHIDQMYKRLHYKSIEWSYEKEYRLVKVFFPEIPTVKERQFKFSDNDIAEIIIGLKATKEAENDICRIAKKKGIKVYKTTQIPFSSDIDRIRIL